MGLLDSGKSKLVKELAGLLVCAHINAGIIIGLQNKI